jgi:hypothetical protein
MMRVIHAARQSLLPSVRKRTFTISIFLAVMIVASALTGCAVRLIGDYDDTIDKGVTNVQQSAEEYFSKLQSTPSTPYDQSVYDDLDARLVVLSSRASALPKYSIIVKQIAELKNEIDDFQKIDKAATRPLTSHAFVNDGESAIAVTVESILKLELALKRGATPPSSSTSK